MRPPSPGRVAAAAGFALCLGLTVVVAFTGFSATFPLRLVEGIAVFAVAAVVLLIPLAWLFRRLSDYRTPTDEAEFERVVERSESLAASGTAADPDEVDFLEEEEGDVWDPYTQRGFEELVREALDELSPEMQRALQRNVAVVISDYGRRVGAYGLYHGDGVARDNHPDRVVIYRDTLLRDFGHDPDELRAQVTRTVRHELAHHLGWDELGVRGLGL